MLFNTSFAAPLFRCQSLFIKIILAALPLLDHTRASLDACGNLHLINSGNRSPSFFTVGLSPSYGIVLNALRKEETSQAVYCPLTLKKLLQKLQHASQQKMKMKHSDLAYRTLLFHLILMRHISCPALNEFFTLWQDV